MVNDLFPNLKESQTSTQHSIETALCEDALNGSFEDKLNALEYFHKKSELHALIEIEHTKISKEQTLGDQFSSLVWSVLSLGLSLSFISLIANWSCGSSQTQLCKDARHLSESIVQYLVFEKPIESQSLK